MLLSLPPHWGIGLASKSLRARTRKLVIQAGSLFRCEISRTTSSFKPLRDLKT